MKQQNISFRFFANTFCVRRNWTILKLKKKILPILVLSMMSFSLNAQNSFHDSLSLCSNMMDVSSYFWKKDSLANNGYRLSTYDKMSNCKLDIISRDALLKYLGRPIRVEKISNNVEEYIYFTYDYRQIPKGEVKSKVVYFISFLFKNDNGTVVEISTGHYD